MLLKATVVSSFTVEVLVANVLAACTVLEVVVGDDRAVLAHGASQCQTCQVGRSSTSCAKCFVDGMREPAELSLTEACEGSR